LDVSPSEWLHSTIFPWTLPLFSVPGSQWLHENETMARRHRKLLLLRILFS
jgi:hypothetical protein